MTLHLAITEVLTSSGRPMSTREIADEVSRRGLYSRGDGAALPASQVSARVRNYPALFTRTDGGIWLTGRPEAAQDGTAPATPTPAAMRHSPPSDPSAENPSAPAEALLDPAVFRNAGDVDAEVPDAYGLYAIRVRDVSALPDPFRSTATGRSSNLIYIGEATGQTLRRRFLRNELRGQGHGTFFRSLGAVLGYRPVAGSLAGMANQRNYRFSPTDTESIVAWINANLLVSWVQVDHGIHNMEVALIRAHTPLLNLRDNPAALRDLSELRALCCRLAASHVTGL
ncbi:MAG: HTH domain-containing protein [Microbacterium sp.]|uniref:GIY-YIG nuclease family protein n=1 Tax=Microbacterium sp. TaxID=51671 RepID=UPI0027273FB5|nr:HTH domain-containing protein [Microbacterium sp.]MDO8382806.1 HTH domain-containing protein [Microbacterium sp.]